LNPEETTRAILASDGHVLIEQCDGTFAPAPGETDWARLQRMSEAEIERQVTEDTEAPAMEESAWADAVTISPPENPLARKRNPSWYPRPAVAFEAGCYETRR